MLAQIRYRMTISFVESTHTCRFWKFGDTVVRTIKISNMRPLDFSLGMHAFRCVAFEHAAPLSISKENLYALHNFKHHEVSYR